MTQDEIIRMAREAGFTDYYPERLTRFAALVVAHERKKCEKEMSLMEEHCAELILIEREACAKVCDELQWYSAPINFAENCAKVIRARNNHG